jgi:hypothetical protein
MVEIQISDELKHRISSVLQNEKDEFKKDFEDIFYIDLDEEDKEYRNYFGIARDNYNKISFLDKKKIVNLNYSDYWNPDKRIMSNVGRIIKQLLPNVSDKNLERFVQLYTNQNKQCYDCVDTSIIKIVEGEDIRHWYLEKQYSSYNIQTEGNNSNLWESCMRHYSFQDYLDIYCKNIGIISMAIITTDTPKLKARCLLWKKDDVTYYDRIYAINNEVNLLMQNCLEKLGFINISSKNIIKPSIIKNIDIRLNYGEHDLEYFPYADTFYSLEGRIVSNYGESNMQETDGTLSNEEVYTCPHCGEEHESDEDFREITRGRMRYELVCSSCWTIDYNDDYILIDDSVNTDYNGTCHEDDVVELYNGRDCHCDNAVELYDGDYAHKDDDDLLRDIKGNLFINGDDNFIEWLGDYYHINHSDIIEINGDYYHIDSDEIEYDKELEEYKIIENV